jgi:hypothetical protein
LETAGFNFSRDNVPPSSNFFCSANTTDVKRLSVSQINVRYHGLAIIVNFCKKSKKQFLDRTFEPG